MSYARFVCWRQERLGTVMDTEALQPSRSVFLATHHPIRMYRASHLSDGARTDYDEQQFLKDFLRPADFAFAAVLGEAGTGKSHLIRWLDLSIPRSARRRVLLIPKVGTNLKSIIGRILEDMEGPKFDEYRRRLQEGTQSITDGEARERLLANLAIAVGPSQPRDRDLTDAEKYLVKHLPDLLLDGVFRRHLLRDGGKLHELVTHVLGRTDRVERADKPKEFTVADLPLEVEGFKNAGASARQLYSLLLNDDSTVRATLQWINEHLGIAVRQLLNLSGENLLELMLDVREALAEQQTELVLLIEDFAKLQGIDKQLLEALLVRTHQEGRRPLCALRTALAVTTGYFQRLEDTVKTRITFRVEMDVSSADAGGIITNQDLERFGARYLNAVRLPGDALDEWAEGLDEHPEEPPPNACQTCPHVEVCHASFGERDGIGLYPFNAAALAEMTDRASGGSGAFNPRLLINRVLFDTLDKYTVSLRDSQFPPPALLHQFGRAKLPAAVTAELRRRDPQQWERRQVLLDLWSSSNRVVDLPAGVHEAFDIPALGAEVERPEDATSAVAPNEPIHGAGGEPQAPTTPMAALPQRLAQQLHEIDEWQNGHGAEPSQGTAQALRELVFRAVVEHIDWDAELLHRGTFAGGARCLLQQRYVTFSSLPERTRSGSFGLVIPVEIKDLNEAALALQGLLQYDHYGHWAYPGGAELRRIYARQLEKWAAAVLEEVGRPTLSGAVWDPVPTLVELLAIGARMHGYPSAANPSIQDFVAGIFEEWKKPSDEAHRSQGWKALASALRQRRQDLQDLLIARVMCTKGWRFTAQIVDASRIVKPLREVRASWSLSTSIPDDLPRDLAYLSELKRRSDATLLEATEAERTRLLEWSDKMAELLGDSSRDELLKAAEQLMATAADAGLSGNRAAIQAAMEGFPSRQALKALRESIARLRTASDRSDVLAEVSRDSGEDMAAVSTFMHCWNQYMDVTEARLQSRMGELEQAGGQTLDAAEQQLLSAMSALTQHVEAMLGATTC